jgi:hypothetical protein
MLGFVSTACEEEPEPDPMPAPAVVVAYPDQWARVADVEADLFGAERPADLVCDETGLSLESVGPDPAFEIQTDLCDYATAQQPTLVALAPGDTLSVRVFHWSLVADEAAEAHLALALGGEVVWERYVPIPSEPDLLEEDVVIERDLPAGTPLQFHVHNHGDNAYDILELKATPAVAE